MSYIQGVILSGVILLGLDYILQTIDWVEFNKLLLVLGMLFHSPSE